MEQTSFLFQQASKVILKILIKKEEGNSYDNSGHFWHYDSLDHRVNNVSHAAT